MRNGKMPKSGDVILTRIQFTDSYEVKTRPGLILFEECGNFVVAGITSNNKMKGIPLSKKEGAIKDSVIKLNYIFSVSSDMISKVLFSLSIEKKKIVYLELIKKIELLNK